jgi:hypothetical protein
LRIKERERFERARLQAAPSKASQKSRGFSPSRACIEIGTQPSNQ